MAIYVNNNKPITQSHTIAEFLLAKQNVTTKSYHDLSFIETIDGKEMVIKQILDDYIDILKSMSVTVNLTDLEVDTYKFNPKLLSYKIYGSTAFYYVILRLNDMCNVHLFNLANKSLQLLPPSKMNTAISQIYNSEKFSISRYNNNHKNDQSLVIIDKTR